MTVVRNRMQAVMGGIAEHTAIMLVRHAPKPIIIAVLSVVIPARAAIRRRKASKILSA